MAGDHKQNRCDFQSASSVVAKETDHSQSAAVFRVTLVGRGGDKRVIQLSRSAISSLESSWQFQKLLHKE